MLVERWDGRERLWEALQEERDRADNARSIGVTVRSTMTSTGDYVVITAGCYLTTVIQAPGQG
jgi:ethanolamine utilization protein EutA (predicted chaperonin)